MAATARCVLSFDPQGGIKRESDQLSRVPKPAGTDVLTGEGFGQAGPREPCTREDRVGRGGANLQMPPPGSESGGWTPDSFEAQRHTLPLCAWFAYSRFSPGR